MGIIGNPAHARFYGERNDRMPKFKDNGVLDDTAIGLLADWLTWTVTRCSRCSRPMSRTAP